MHLYKSSLRCTRMLSGVALIAFAIGANAQVTLHNAVQKVERFVNDAGRVETRLVTADEVVPGDELHYTIVFENSGQAPVDPDSIVITNPVPEQTEYIDGTASGTGTDVVFSVDQGGQFAQADVLTMSAGDENVPASARDYTTIRWMFSPSLEPGEKSEVSFNVRLK